MRKISIVMLLSSLLFSAELINLTGEYAKELGNPFRVLLNKKNQTIKVYSQDKDVELKVSSNFQDSIYKTHNFQVPNKIILSNKTVVNILKQYYAEEFNVEVNKSSDVELNVQSGEVEILFINEDDNHQIPLIDKVIVSLTLEIIKNGRKEIKNISMDNKLGVTGDNYNWSLTLDDISNIKLENLNIIIKKIIENELYQVMRG